MERPAQAAAPPPAWGNAMNSDYAELKSDDRIVARFLTRYHQNWQKHFPGLTKRAHWYVIFYARSGREGGVSCRSLHRALYGIYGTDIRTCIERIKDCEQDGFVRVATLDDAPCTASPACLIKPTDRLFDHFDRHCREIADEVCAIFSGTGRVRLATVHPDKSAIAALSDFFGAYEHKWREMSEFVARQKGLTPAHLDDAMDHLVTYQYWAIVMLLWGASPYGGDEAAAPALVIDEINSRMWDTLRLGHLAIKERVGNLIRWGFFAEETIKKHKAVSLTPVAGMAISKNLAETKPLLRELHSSLVAGRAEAISA
ncbi:MAG: hypothetical protein ACREFK_19255 [Stellaceae bacterium]